jgi:hypothetical protein
MMKDFGMLLIIILSIGLAISLFVAKSNSDRASQEATRVKNYSLEISKLRDENQQAQKSFFLELAEQKKENERSKRLVEGFTKIIEQRKIQFPWLATAMADLNSMEAIRDAEFLQNKRHPAVKSAEVVRVHALKRREAEQNYRIMRYRVDYYESLFPWIKDYVGDDVPDSVVDVSSTQNDTDVDPASEWLTKAEYERLPSAEKFQKALDNWRKRKKTNWQIGRDYERYIGYVYETMGFDVEFTGAIEGFEDMGRDLIAKKGSDLKIIQCKYWSAEKTIREKHIFQLFGSSFEYAFRLGKIDTLDQTLLFRYPTEAIGIKPILFTSTKLSEIARDVASKLGVEVHEEARISDYPLVKCNVSPRGGEKIYHLPFDQQYDRVKIIPAKGERYAYTVNEAEDLGFRRAFRWRGNN